MIKVNFLGEDAKAHKGLLHSFVILDKGAGVFGMVFDEAGVPIRVPFKLIKLEPSELKQ